MHIDKILCLDVLGSKFPKMNFIEPVISYMLHPQYDEAFLNRRVVTQLTQYYLVSITERDELQRQEEQQKSIVSILQTRYAVLRLDNSSSDLVQILLMQRLSVRLRPSGLLEDVEIVEMSPTEVLKYQVVVTPGAWL